MRSVHLSRLLRAAVVVGLTSAAFAAHSQSTDVAAAEKLLEESKCGKCHSVDKQKDGPAYKKTAAKYKGKADGEAKLFTHMTSAPTVEIDGVKEEHVKIKSKDEAAIKNVARYILSR
jgi:cytochrome c